MVVDYNTRSRGRDRLRRNSCTSLLYSLLAAEAAASESMPKQSIHTEQCRTSSFALLSLSLSLSLLSYHHHYYN